MTSTQDKKPDVRALIAVGLCVMVPIALAVAAYASVTSMIRETEASLVVRQETLARLQSVIEASRRALAAPASEVASELRGDFLSGTQDSIIVAELQNRLRALAIGNRVEFNSANTLPVRTVDRMAYLGLRIVMRGQVPDVQRVLHSIESGVPLLFIERVNIRVDTWPMKSTDPAIDGAAALVVEMDVFGVRQPVSPASTSAAAAHVADPTAIAKAPSNATAPRALAVGPRS